MTPTLGKAGARSVGIDVEHLCAGRALISAMSGSGKSWALRRFLEQTYGQIPHIVIDKEGEFYTLRERFDYLLAGGQDADCAADPRSAALLAPTPSLPRAPIDLSTEIVRGAANQETP